MLRIDFLSAKSQIAAKKFVPYLEDYCKHYEINTPKRLSAFLANVAHESAEFTHMEENLNYSAEGLAKTWPVRFKSYDGSPNSKAVTVAHNKEKIANAVYCDRMGNGPMSSGDGWKYHGRGLIQLTGRDNYRDCGVGISRDLIDFPELVLSTEVAVLSACWFWDSRNLNALADKSDMVSIRKKINGGQIGMKEVMRYYEKLRNLLGD